MPRWPWCSRTKRGAYAAERLDVQATSYRCAICGQTFTEFGAIVAHWRAMMATRGAEHLPALEAAQVLAGGPPPASK
jgi:hypothetical protein